MQKNSDKVIRKANISELPDIGYIYVRNQPCRITLIETIKNESKYTKKEPKASKAKTQKAVGSDDEEGEDEDETRIRFDIVAENLFSGKEVYRGIVKGPTVDIPVMDKATFNVRFKDKIGCLR